MVTELQIKNVSKTFQSRAGGIGALEEITLGVDEGEFLCLVGPSGCGKSTLLSMVAGLESIDQGQILLDGRSINGPGSERVMIFQEGALFPWLNVVENVEFGLRHRLSPAERRQKAMAYLRLVHLDRF